MLKSIAGIAVFVILGSCWVSATGSTEPDSLADSPPTELAVARAQPGPEGWSLLDHEGGTVRDRDFHGRFRLMAFGYTSCPDICPTTLSDLAEIMDDLGHLARYVVPLFVTIDPQRDTQAVLADYVAHFDPRIVAITGAEAQLESVRQAYGVVTVPGPVSEDGSYFIAHSASRYLVGPGGDRIQDFDHDHQPEVIVTYLRQLFARIGL